MKPSSYHTHLQTFKGREELVNTFKTVFCSFLSNCYLQKSVTFNLGISSNRSDIPSVSSTEIKQLDVTHHKAE